MTYHFKLEPDDPQAAQLAVLRRLVEVGYDANRRELQDVFFEACELQRAQWTGKALLALEADCYVMRSQRQGRFFPTAKGRLWAQNGDVFLAHPSLQPKDSA